MLTFNQAGKDDLIAKLEVHAAADDFSKGKYWSDGKGCAVGCTLHDYGVDTSDHSQYEALFGIPKIIARFEDGIFEGLTTEESKEWPLRFSNAVPVNKDLSGVWPKFAIALMIDEDHGIIRHAKTDEQRQAIIDCAGLYRDGPCSDVDGAWRVLRCVAAAYAAYAASDAAGYVAAAAAAAYAYAAAYAADAEAAVAAAVAAASAAASAAADDADAAYAEAAEAAVAAAEAAVAAASAVDDAVAAAYAVDAAARKSHYTWMADKLVEILEAA